MRDYRVLILSTCSSLKRFPINSECKLDGYKGEPYDQVLSNWLETIQDLSKQKFPAQNLYIGSNWKEVLSCNKTSDSVGFISHLWVVSAGWGLIPVNFNITPYSASFSEGKSSIHNLKWPQEFNGKQRSIGCYATAELGAAAWDVCARKIGRSNKLNFPLSRDLSHVTLPGWLCEN